MKIRENSGRCIAGIGSVTQAMKAQKILDGAAIPTTVVKQETTSRRLGCIHGVQFSCAQESNVRHVLEAAHVTVKQWSHIP